MVRSRAWTFTINNHTYDDLVQMLDINFRYLCFGFECVSTPHIQGYMYMYDQKSVESMSKKMPRAHLEVSKGTSQQNAIYTSKKDDWYEFGDRPLQGRATWHKIKEAMANPKDNPTLYNQYRKMFREITLKKTGDHERILTLLNEGDKYSVLNQYGNDDICLDIDLYDGEQVVMLKCYINNDWVVDWLHGMSHKIKRGYEIICVDPKVVYILYSDIKERHHLTVKYMDYL